MLNFGEVNSNSSEIRGCRSKLLVVVVFLFSRKIKVAS